MTGSFSLAVHALVYLHHKNATLSSEALAENICTNPARVRKVLAGLKKAGLVATREGADGGYTLLPGGGAITLDVVARAVNADFVTASWRPGDADMDCLIASGMAGLLDELYAELDSLCRERLSHITISDMERRLFDGR